MLFEWWQSGSIEIVLHISGAAVHWPEVMPHRWAARRVLVDDELVEQTAVHPLAPVQRRVAERRPQHLTSRDADADTETGGCERRAQLHEQCGDVIAQQVAP